MDNTLSSSVLEGDSGLGVERPVEMQDGTSRKKGPKVGSTSASIYRGTRGVPKAPSALALGAKKRRFIQKVLEGPEEKPLDVLLERMHWLVGRARTLEKALGGVETKDDLAQMLELTEKALDAASRAAPYIHARLAPMLQKGETGVSVTLLIEGA